MLVTNPKWDPRWLDEQGHDEIVDSMRFDPGFPDRILDRLDDGDLSRAGGRLDRAGHVGGRPLPHAVPDRG